MLCGARGAVLRSNIAPFPSKRKLTFNLLDPNQAIEISQNRPKRGHFGGIFGPNKSSKKDELKLVFLENDCIFMALIRSKIA